jgi:PAS domain S-box-containing protein
MPEAANGGWRPLKLLPSRRALVLVAAALLFAMVFILRVLVKNPDDPVTLLFVLPIALIAVELGMAAGLAAAALALGLYGCWDVALAERIDQAGAIDYLSRGLAFFVLGGVVGRLVDNLRRRTREADRFWEISTDLMCTIGFDGYFNHLNASWEGTLGWTPQELRAQPFIEFVHPEDREETEAEAAKLYSAPEETLNFENRYRCKDGSYRNMLWGARSVPEEELIYGTARDVSNRKLAEEAAEAARAEAERANLAKSEFLSRMSHELRTPLNAVIGFGQLLELDELDPSQRESVEQILKAGRHLLQLINEVLDISRIESGTMSISLEPVHLGSVLADALSLIRPLADEAHVRLVGDPGELAELHVLADQQRLRQVLINLLSNAIKYNHRGGEASVHCEMLPAGRVAVAIADTGRGMSAEMLERLFDPFDRLGAERTTIEGTGLGLSVSRGLMEAMGGTIKASSQPEAGTTMRIELDRTQASGDDAATSSAAPATANGSLGGKVLYIEDNLSNMKLVQRVIDRLPGVRLLPAMQGRLGLDLARRHHPELILLDLHLPDLHGREVLEQLKSDPATATIPVVIMSADATTAQVSRLKAEGAAEYLTKPIDVETLLNITTGALQSSSRELPRLTNAR